MKFLARVTGDDFGGAREVALQPDGARYQLNTRPRLPVGALIAVTLPGLDAPTPGAIQAWLGRDSGEARITELRPHLFRPATLGDLLDAINGDAFLGAARDWNLDAVTAFARDRGGDLLAEIRRELDGELRAAPLLAKARRFANIVGLPDAVATLDELDTQHAVEQLLGLEHALVRWVGGASGSRTLELAALGRLLPDEDASAGISDEWFHWWWRLARAATRTQLATSVHAVIAHVDTACTSPGSAAARGLARDMAGQLALARHATLWSSPPRDDLAAGSIPRDPHDAHYIAFMAVSHAAHALAYELGRRLSPSHANRTAMRTLAGVALAALADH